MCSMQLSVLASTEAVEHVPADRACTESCIVLCAPLSAPIGWT